MAKTTAPITLPELEEVGNYNNWRGYVEMYFTLARVRTLKNYGITRETTIKDAFGIMKSKSVN